MSVKQMANIHVYSDNVYVRDAVKVFTSQLARKRNDYTDMAIFLFEKTWLEEEELQELLSFMPAKIIVFAKQELHPFIYTIMAGSEVILRCYNISLFELENTLNIFTQEGIDERKQISQQAQESVRLTYKEQKIISFLLTGNSVFDISLMMARNYKTISAHKRNAMKKLGISSNISLVQKGPLFVYMNNKVSKLVQN